MSKYFTISKELLLVNFVKYAMQTKYANSLKNEPQYERLLWKFPTETHSGQDYDTFLIYLLLFENKFI